MKYPEYQDKIYGSIQPTCRAHYLTELTNERIGTLKNWSGGTVEDDVCNGSVKIIEEIDSDYMEKEHRIFGYKKRS